jgi:hypothetical protein
MRIFEDLRKKSYNLIAKFSHRFKDRIVILIGFIYWLFLAISSGMIEFYPFSLADALSKTVANRPVFIYYHNFDYFLTYGGLYWFPTYHIGITFPVLQFTLSVFLSVLISLVLKDILKIKNNNSLKRRNGIMLGSSMLSLISTTGACCSLPFVYYALSLVMTTSASFGVTLFFSSYSYFIDEALIVLLAFLHFRNKRIINLLTQTPDIEKNNYI